jgi:hypothetical protein
MLRALVVPSAHFLGVRLSALVHSCLQSPGHRLFTLHDGEADKSARSGDSTRLPTAMNVRLSSRMLVAHFKRIDSWQMSERGRPFQLANSYKLESQESTIVDTTQYNSRACVTSGPESCLDLVSWPRLETALFPDLIIDTVSYSTARSKTCSKETENLYPRV